MSQKSLGTEIAYETNLKPKSYF